MGRARAALALVAVVAAGALLVSGGSGADPRTPRGLPGMPPPFLGTALVGGGGLTAAIDAYGDVVDLRVPGPAGRALIDNPSERQAAGTVPMATGIVPVVSIDGGRPRPLWTADSVSQRYRPGTNVLITTAHFGVTWVRIVYGADRSLLACVTRTSRGATISMRSSDPGAAERLRCDDAIARRAIWGAERDDRRWLQRAAPLSAGAPRWARSMYGRSLLVLRALTGRRTGAIVAGSRDGWAYVWPRDASAVAIAYAAAGYRDEAARVVRFLLGLRLEDAARFEGDGSPVPGRPAQGDALGWVAAAARAAGLLGGAARSARAAEFLDRNAARVLPPTHPSPWRGRPDYQEGEPGNYLGNAIASGADVSDFMGRNPPMHPPTPGVGLDRVAGEPASGLDSAAAWAVRPFARPHLYPAVRSTLNRLISQATPYGITPGESWPGGKDPWSAPTAWTAWSLAALARRDARHGATAAALRDRRLSLRLLDDLRRAATPAGALPERVNAHTGTPRSTTPLAWSHAFAILTLRELWPPGAPTTRLASTSTPSSSRS